MRNRNNPNTGPLGRREGFLDESVMVAESTLTATSQPQRNRGTLLIVDDEEGARLSLRVIFKDDYEVLLAPDGATAIDIVQKQKVDVAIVDIRMHGMSGVEVLERIKYIDATIEVLMITAFETTDTIRQALRLRACDYINKPFDIPALRAAVSGAIQRHTLDTEVFNNTEKLQQLYQELQKQQEAGRVAQTRGDIYASIIHDINGPLTVISGFLQLINQRIGDGDTLDAEGLAFLKDRLRTMTRQVTNCIEISRRYLSSFSRQPAEFARVGVNQLFNDLEHVIRVHPRLLNNECLVQPLDEDIGVKLNGTEFIQLLLNLAVNAFQASPEPHRVEISGAVVESPVDLAAYKDGPGERLLNVENFQNVAPLLRVSVRDNGPGIPTEVLPKIFEPYFTTKDAREGTGLGLNIVQRFVRAGSGTLHVRTAPGEGTEFTVILPATPLAK